VRRTSTGAPGKRRGWESWETVTGASYTNPNPFPPFPLPPKTDLAYSLYTNKKFSPSGKNFPGATFSGATHRGFTDAANALWPSVRAAIDAEVLARGAALTSVVVSGHSLGGGVGGLLAYQAARYLSARGKRRRLPPVAAVLFGTPAAGDAAFMADLAARVNVRSVVFSEDGAAPRHGSRAAVFFCFLRRGEKGSWDAGHRAAPRSISTAACMLGSVDPSPFTRMLLSPPHSRPLESRRAVVPVLPCQSPTSAKAASMPACTGGPVPTPNGNLTYWAG
jgi:hypothetical protein